MFKVHKNMSRELMWQLFCVIQTHYDLTNPRHFAIASINSVYHGSESISYFRPRNWNLVLDLGRVRLSKNFISRIGFL